MSDGRALLTERERKALREDETGSYRYKTRTYIRNRLEKLERDVELLREHEPELYEQLQSVVCEGHAPAEGGTDATATAAEADVAGQPAERGAGPPRERAGAEASESGATAALDSVGFPSGKDREACVAAVMAARDVIHKRGGATKAELVRVVMPENPLGYDVDDALSKLDAGDRYRGGWWRSVVKDGLEALPDVEKPAKGGSRWTPAEGGENDE